MCPGLLRPLDLAPLRSKPPPLMSETAPAAPASLDFIREMIAADVAAGRNGGQVITRFPPEPNGSA